jgi:glycosyltransferase involved in cell wall biosynthesis/Flp pilus assembly protein TadD
MPSLSVCLIVRNEERHLARCLASVRGLADEIVVVDTGSTDATVAIAREHGARVYEYAWQDDFSRARNFSIDQATGDWILSLDADESIARRDHDVIRATMAEEGLDAEFVPQRHYYDSTAVPVGWQAGSGGYEEGEPYPGFLDVFCRRLFRNRPWLRFQKPVHEELLSIDAARPLRQRQGAWVIHHYGKLAGAERLREKGEGYLRIGQQKAAAHPGDPQAHFELGIQYAELERPAEAIACFRQTLALSPRFRDALLRLALCQNSVQDYRGALTTLRRAERAMPDRADEVAFNEGNAHLGLADLRAAEAAYRRSLARNPKFVLASMNLAAVYATERRFAEALTVLDEAIAASPVNLELVARRGAIRLDLGDETGALADLERSAGDPRALWLRARILTRQRRFHEAADCLRSVPDTTGADVLALRGAIALGLGQLDDARRWLGESLQQRPTVEAAMNLSIATEAVGDRTASLDAAIHASRLAPADSTVLGRVAALAGLPARRHAADGQGLTIFFYQPFSIAFDGDTPRTRGLGGTESAVVYLAEALARRGHRCVVLNNCPADTVVNGVEYTRWEALAGRAVADRPDVLVGVRFWEAIGRARLAPLQILWTGDAFDQPFVQQLSQAQRRTEIDLFVLQSDWQIETFHAHHGVPRSQIVRTALGAAASAAVPPIVAPAGPRPRRLAYASTPFRGLDVLLDLFPWIRRAVPDAELDVFSSMQVYGVSAEEDRKQFDAIYRKAAQRGVNLVGSVPQLELAARLQQARVLAYPNHFAETFCIAAAEAQAAGCVVVTSRLGALPETVGAAGVCIPGDPRSGAYQEAFVAECVGLLTDDRRWLQMSGEAAAQASANYAWPAIAAHWEEVCRAALTVEPPEIERAAAHVIAGRAALAQRMVERVAKPADVPDAVWQALHAVVAGAAAGRRIDQGSLHLAARYFPSVRRIAA